MKGSQFRYKFARGFRSIVVSGVSRKSDRGFFPRYLEVDGGDFEDDPGEEALVRHEPVLAVDVLSRARLLVNEGVERRAHPALRTLPRGEYFIANRVRDRVSEVGVVEEIVMSPVVQRGPGKDHTRHAFRT